jgi:hypothetical protein
MLRHAVAPGSLESHCQAANDRGLPDPWRSLQQEPCSLSWHHALRRALAAWDGGCVAPGCDRPPQWSDAHHLEHWADGGPTDLGNLALLCRTHHLAVHEGGWQLAVDPASGQVTLTPPARRHHGRGHSPPAA